MKVTTAISLIFTLSALLIPGMLMRIFTNDPVLIRGGSLYLRVIAVSYLLTGISQMYLCILKNSGRAAKSSMISATSVVVNIFINAVLIYGLFGMPRMEIAGAALATVTARIIEVTWCVLETVGKDQVKLRAKYLRRDDPVLRRDFWKYTTPVICNEIVWGTGFSMYSVIMGHLGSDAVAANSIASIVKNLAGCFCMGLGNGGGIMVGNELGAGKLEKAKEYGRRLCHLSVSSGIVSGLVLLAFSPLILRAANLSVTAEGYLKGMLLICAYYMIGRSVNGVTISGIFCAGGDSKFGLYCDCISMWCIMVPLGLIAAFVLKLPVLAVYFIISLDEFVKIPAVYLNYKKYRWVKDLTEKQTLPEQMHSQSPQRQQIQIKGNCDTDVWRTDGSQRNGSCNGPGDHGRYDHYRIFQIQGKRRSFRIVFPAQLAGEHDGKSLVAGDGGSDNGSQ